MTKAWDEWIDQHGPQLVLYARNWSIDFAEAEDLVQEAFVRFWRNRNGAKDTLAYLYRCVRTVATDRHRSRNAERTREAVCARAEVQSSRMFARIEADERRRFLESAIESLSSGQAEVVKLKIWSGLTLAQIANVTETPVGTVATRYRSAIGKLREILVEIESR